MDLDLLISEIKSLDGSLKHEASKAVNRLLTIRNWLIGYYIVEYEQKGEDRAKYGDDLLNVLSDSLDIKGLSVTNLKINRLFYITYPQIRQTLSDQLSESLNIAPNALRIFSMGIGQTVSDQLEIVENQSIGISQTLSDQSDQSKYKLLQMPSVEAEDVQLAGNILIKLSFSHITLLLSVDDPLKRAFYAIEAIKGTWSVRELKRQINSLLYERSGMSGKPEQLLQSVNKNADKRPVTSFIKDIYSFEFLGLPVKDAIEESDLETALLDHLQQFMLEMGHGFCLEARQKRILIGDEYFFIDLVFYHRLLKCHILVDLKIDAFDHQNAGQLNTYLNYYKKEMRQPDDNAPVGILLVAGKNDALVEYATAGMDEQLFVRKYLLQLPDKSKIEAFIKSEMNNLQ